MRHRKTKAELKVIQAMRLLAKHASLGCKKLYPARAEDVEVFRKAFTEDWLKRDAARKKRASEDVEEKHPFRGFIIPKAVPPEVEAETRKELARRIAEMADSDKWTENLTPPPLPTTGEPPKTGSRRAKSSKRSLKDKTEEKTGSGITKPQIAK